MNKCVLLTCLVLTMLHSHALAAGRELWLAPLSEAATVVNTTGRVSPTLQICIDELRNSGLGGVVNLKRVKDRTLGRDGYRISRSGSDVTVSACTDLGLLYGSYALMRRAPEGESRPAYDLRLLDHWDNLDGTIERGYAGHSLWQWSELPDSISPRYKEYARANASVGINGTVLNNVNASSQILSAEYLPKVAAIADVFRPYGIRVFLSANFAAPVQLSGLPTADPQDPAVQRWWRDKAKEIYRLIPDFGGFLVKANSEGQPGPCDYGRTHAQGANLLARALKSHGGVVMWRSFVYSPSDPDRAKQAYIEFEPLDGQFDDNVIVQIKNGPIDFQPREPYSPLFGAMPNTAQMAELQITQEYLGHSNHLAYLAPMWEEFFGYVNPASLRAIAGVANIGDDANYTGHPLAQANWYAFGRLAWDPTLKSGQILREWLPLTVFAGSDAPQHVQDTVASMMLGSREAVVDYMMPLGLHHIFAFGHHYGPEPWCDVPGARPDWLPRYYHRADSAGIGFDRTTSGSNAVSQYPAPLAAKLNDPATCPDEYLLWFHHLPWNHRMKSGETLWEALCRRYERGVKAAEAMQQQWAEAEPYVAADMYDDVAARLMTQTRDAYWWRDACLGYFGQLSGMPLPEDVRQPINKLQDLQNIQIKITNFECPNPAVLNQLR